MLHIESEHFVVWFANHAVTTLAHWRANAYGFVQQCCARFGEYYRPTYNKNILYGGYTYVLQMNENQIIKGHWL